MATSRDAITEIIKTGLVPMFKRHGFKKSGFNFARRRGSTGHFFNVQLSQWNNRNEGHFYLNAGVAFDELRLLRSAPPLELPKYDDCDFMVRLEQLNSDLPQSVAVDGSTNTAAMAKWLADAVEETFVVPLSAVESAKDFAATGWAAAIPWGFPAVLQFVLGNKAEARRLVQREADRFADRGLTFESVARNLHLDFTGCA